MSEYQRIAFRAVDGPVSDNDLEYMRRQSTRAETEELARRRTREATPKSPPSSPTSETRSPRTGARAWPKTRPASCNANTRR
jgi:hypothetical protein